MVPIERLQVLRLLGETGYTGDWDAIVEHFDCVGSSPEELSGLLHSDACAWNRLQTECAGRVTAVATNELLWRKTIDAGRGHKGIPGSAPMVYPNFIGYRVLGSPHISVGRSYFKSTKRSVFSGPGQRSMQPMSTNLVRAAMVGLRLRPPLEP